jgi:thiol-disulfide isomerase/thioredoxin
VSDEQRDPSPPEHRGEDAEADIRRAARPYTVVVGILFLVGALVAGLNALSNRPPGTSGLEAGDPLPRFAAPAATGSLAGDANINQDDTDSAGDRQTPACEVPGPAREVVRICDFFDRPLVMIAWFTRGCGTCRRQLDTVERVRKRFPHVAFVGLDVADSRPNAEREVRQHGWHFPMAVDPDGAVSALYRIAVGPLSFFAYPGGTAMETAVGELDERELTARVSRLVNSSRRRGLLP